MFKVINEGKMPTRATKYSAAVDLYANEDVVIGAGETEIIGLGVCIDLTSIFRKFKDELGFKYKCSFVIVDEDYCKKRDELRNKFENFCKSHYLELHPRSSLRAKGLIAGVGIIDLDFIQELKIIIHNPITIDIDADYSYKHYSIKKGDKIAQILLKEHKGYLLGIETEDERVGGFGSTGM